MENLHLHAATLISFVVLICMGFCRLSYKFKETSKCKSFCIIFKKSKINNEYFYCEATGLDEQQDIYTYTVSTGTSDTDTFLLNKIKIITSQGFGPL